MSSKIMRCPECETYTLHDKCPKCGTKTVSTLPAKFSPEDPYGEYRRKAKRETLKKKGLI